MGSIAVSLYQRVKEILCQSIISEKEYQELYVIAKYVDSIYDKVDDNTIHSLILREILIFYKNLNH